MGLALMREVVGTTMFFFFQIVRLYQVQVLATVYFLGSAVRFCFCTGSAASARTIGITGT